MQQLITPEQVRQFEVSDLARKAVKLLEEYQEATGVFVLNQPDYIMVRDYLLTVLCINNGCRSGTLANMTLQEFQSASEENGSFLVKVKKHKTLPPMALLTLCLHELCFITSRSTSPDFRIILETMFQRMVIQQYF